MKRFNDFIDNLYMTCGVIAFSALVVIIGWQVLARYILNDSPSWSEPLAMFLLLYAVMLAAAVGIRRKSHLGLVWFRQKLSARHQLLVDRCEALVIFLFGVSMLYYGLQMAAQTWRYILPGLPIPMGSQYLALVFGGFAIGLFSLENAIGKRN